jgi:DNA-binding XRE family transcriptional regulator
VSKTQFKVLRVEETPADSGADKPMATESIPATPAPRRPAISDDVEHWKRLAIATGERLAIAEEQAKALREAADDARARFGKYKDRLDKAQARVNEQQVDIVRLSARVETLQAQVAERDAQLVTQDALARKVHACRQALIEWSQGGPLWDLFTDLAVCPPTAGEEKR